MVFGVSAWSYYTTGFDLFHVTDEAKKAGFEAFEVLDLPCPDEEAIDYAHRLRAHCEEIGLPILSAANTADFLNGSDGNLQAEIDRLCRKVDVAEALGIHLMRHDVCWHPPEDRPDMTFDEALPRLAQGCRAVTEYAAARGVRTMTEDHGQFAQGIVNMRRLVEAVNHPNYGILLDIGNFMCVDDSPLQAVKELLPLTFHVHCKDFHRLDAGEDPGEGFFRSKGGQWLRGAIIGHGQAQVKECLKALKDGGYNGAMMLEFEGIEDALTGIRIGYDNMKRYWEQV